MKRALSILALATALLAFGCESLKNPPIKLEGISGLKTYTKSEFEKLADKEIEDGLFPVLQTDGEYVPYKFEITGSTWSSVSYYLPEGDQYFKVFYREEDNLPATDLKYFE